MRWKIAIATLLIACLGLIVWLNSRPLPPIPLTGDLSSRDVSEIRIALRRYLRPPIFGHLTLEDLRTAPVRLWQRFTRPYPEFEGIERRTQGFVVVIGHRASPQPSQKYLFYSVFRTTNSWWVFAECELNKN